MILAFKEQFVNPILIGKKIHTLREDKTNRWKPDMSIQMATGVRTKKYNKFNDDTCNSIQQIEIQRTSDFFEDTIVKIDGRKLIEDEVQQLAWNDGFSNLVEFYLWFSEGFEGKIIHWTDKRY